MAWDIERMCRLNGQKPTIREKWTAFYRLWRISQRHGVHQDMEAAECFRILFADWTWIRCIENQHEAIVTRNHVPKFLRRQFLETDRRRRLYGNHPEWKERDKIVARKVREDGIEVTPIEVAEVRQKVIRLARAKGLEMGYRLPDDDDELLRLIKGRSESEESES